MGKNLTVIAEAVAIVAANRENSIQSTFLVFTQDVTAHGSEGTVKHIQFVVIKVIEFEEMREKGDDTSDLFAQAQLSILVITLDQEFVILSDHSGIEWTCTEFLHFVENHVVFDQTRVTLIDALLENETSLSHKVVVELNVWVYAHLFTPNKKLVVCSQSEAVVEPTLQVFCESPLLR